MSAFEILAIFALKIPFSYISLCHLNKELENDYEYNDKVVLRRNPNKEECSEKVGNDLKSTFNSINKVERTSR